MGSPERFAVQSTLQERLDAEMMCGGATPRQLSVMHMPWLFFKPYIMSGSRRCIRGSPASLCPSPQRSPHGRNLLFLLFIINLDLLIGSLRMGGQGSLFRAAKPQVLFLICFTSPLRRALSAGGCGWGILGHRGRAVTIPAGICMTSLGRPGQPDEWKEAPSVHVGLSPSVGGRSPLLPCFHGTLRDRLCVMLS